jgi:hypothetical protein
MSTLQQSYKGTKITGLCVNTVTWWKNGILNDTFTFISVEAL